jgi:uncharacterized protein (DUF427 family)
MKPQPITPQPGQESVWNYPRPAILQDTDKHIKVIFNGIVLAETTKAKRVLETSHPPGYYIPAVDIKTEYLIATSRKTMCEWKGICEYYDISVGDKYINNAAWQYIQPTPNFKSIQEYFSFYPSLMDACYVNDELVKPQAGGFYGGWITSDIVGPFKGEPGTWGW